MGKAVIWRDKVDGDMFTLGIRANRGYRAYARIHIDGIFDMFGEDALHAACKLIPGGEPVEVMLSLTFAATEAGR